MGILSRGARWQREAFLLANKSQAPENIRTAFYTETMFRPFDTTPGANEVINPLPQFTRYADIRVRNQMVRTFGIGRFYDENYGLRQQKIYLRAGVPEFTPLARFFKNAYHAGMGLFAKTGKNTNIVIEFIKDVINVGFTWLLAPPLLVANFAKNAYDFFMGNSSTKFYYFKPAMHMYWNSVQTMVNLYCIERGIIPRVHQSGDYHGKMAGKNNFDGSQLAAMAKIIEVFNKDGTIDIYRYASLGQRRRHFMMKQLSSILDGGNYANAGSIMRTLADNPMEGPRKEYNEYKEYLRAWADAKNHRNYGDVKFHKDAVGNDISDHHAEIVGNVLKKADGLARTDDPPRDEYDSWYNLVKSELNDGSHFVCFRVNHTGEVSESFSSSTVKSEIEEKINGIAAEARSTNFNKADGNYLGIMRKVEEVIKDTFAGITDSLGLSAINLIGGNAYIDIPERWDSSSVDLPTQSYTISLVAPYGNPYSQLFNIYVPLFMLMGFALPRATGAQSYTSPPLVQLFDRGRQVTRLGMMTSLSIRRGTTNLSFNKDMVAMGIDVNFTVKDLSSIMVAPIIARNSSNISASIFSEENTFTDYMANLAGTELNDLIYPSRRLSVNVTRYWTNIKTWFTSARSASLVAHHTPLSVVKAFTVGVLP